MKKPLVLLSNFSYFVVIYAKFDVNDSNYERLSKNEHTENEKYFASIHISYLE